MLKVFKSWLPLALAITLLSLMTYGVVQQSLRLSANDPQIQMAEDTVTAILGGAKPESLVSPRKVEISKSLSPFMIIYDNSGKIIGSSAVLDNQMPVVPEGALENAKKNGQNRITWQPENNVRIAAVVEYHGGDNPGFVLAGRSLREIEKREDVILFDVFVGWTIIIFSTFVLTVFIKMFLPKKLS